MVTENEMAESVVDEITQTQQQLDQEQGIPAEQTAVAPMSAEHVLQEQVRSLQSQVSGLQSMINTGLNSIRKDTENWAKEQLGSLQGQLARDRWMEGLDENDKQLVGPMMERIQQLESQLPSATTQPQPTQQVDMQAAWEQVYQFVENSGLSRNNPAIRYDILTNTALPDDQKRNQFIAHLQQVRGTVPSQPPAAQPPSQPPPATPNPPVEAPSGTQGSMSREQIMDLYIENKLASASDPSGHAAYRELMAKNGFQIDS